MLIEELGEDEVEEVYEANIDDIMEIGEVDSTHLGCIRVLPFFDELNERSLDTLVVSIVSCTLA